MMLHARSLLSWPVDIWRRMPVLIIVMIVVGAVLGGTVAPFVQSGFEAFDRSNPVLVANVSVIEASAEDVIVSIKAVKQRECTYVGMQAYTRDHLGNLHDASIARIDQPERGATKPLGKFDMGLWRIWPRSNGDAILIYSNHACSGRIVLTKLAEITIK